MTHMPPNDLPIAVVGLGCRLPGADSLDDYWTLIRDGRSGIIELPPEKIDCDLYYDPEPGKLGRSYTKLGGVVAERPLDPAICRLPAKLVENADAAHLIMCEVAAMAFRNAGYDPHNIAARNAGVYIGHSGGSVLAGEIACHVYTEEVIPYLRENAAFQALPEAQQLAILQGVIERVHRTTASRNADGGPEIGASNVSALISQAFGLSGPALATDAACASSLIAMAMGIQALRQGQIDMALVGGASCSKWYALVLFSQAKSISGTGSRPFDANADGLISSDGYAAVVLKTLPKAIQDGDNIQAVIRGIGVSSDGRGKSLWAPRKEGQILAVNRAYGRDIDPAWLQYVECHATSTQVGDATELSALSLAFKDRLPAGRKLPIGSVKANIGHTLESAGIAGFLKAVLCMRNQTIPGQINFHTPNPDVPWKDIPFQVPTQAQPWPEPVAGRPRRTAVNAFGIGGLNVHVVMDDRLVERTRVQGLVPDNTSGTAPARAASPDDLAIAIVGAAAVLPGALTLSAYWDLLVSGRDPKVDVPDGRWSPEIYYDPTGSKPCRARNRRGGFITDFVYDWKKHKVPPKQIANANPLQFMLLDAADQALRDSGYHQKAFDRQRACVIVGSVYGGDFACEMQMGLRIPEFQKHIREELRSRGIAEDQVEEIATSYQDLLLKHMPALLDETGSFTASTLASRLTKTFDLMGGAFSLDASDVSSLAAIGAAMGMLQDGAADMVLCAACQRSMDVNVYEGFHFRETLAAGNPHAAFSADYDGVVPGEGAGVLILKRLSDARRDGDHIRGVIRGIGAALNVDSHSTAYRESFERSLGQAQISAAAISVVETASTGTRADDAEVITSLQALLQSPERPVPAVVGSVSSQIGHTMGLSGLASVLKATVELEHGQIPATPGLIQTIPELASRNDTVRAAKEAQPLYATLEQGKTLVAVSNSATNGAVYSLLIEGGDKLPPPPRREVAAPATTVVSTAVRGEQPLSGTGSKTIRLTAESRSGLAALFRNVQSHAADVYAQGGASTFAPSAAVRVSLVANGVEHLERQARLAGEHLQRASGTFLLDDNGVFVRDGGGNRPKVALLFPGQGSQYAGMLRPLAEQIPAAAKLLREIDDELRGCGCPTFAEMAWNTPNQLGSDVFLTQLSMLVANTLSYRLLEAQGLRPDVISCHSYGEFPALVAAGVLTLRDAIQATRERTRSVESRESTKGSLLSTTAPLELVERVLKQVPGGAYLASHNAPDQSVIGGADDAVQVVRRLLESEGFATRTLAVPRPYHTPLLSEAQPAFAAALAQITMRDPQTRLLSSVSLRDVRSAAEARQNLVDQLTTPVRYVELIQQLAAEGVTVFIEVGPNRVLTRLNQRILAGQTVSIVPMDVPQLPGAEGITRIQALLDAAGVTTAAPLATSAKVLFFDATQRRRTRGTVAAAAMPLAAAAMEPSTALVTQPAMVEQPAAVASSTEIVTTVRLDRAAVAKFMVNYVVDQTGYPEDMVEMTADLEADLGIDSIKKAQLIGELAENFELTHLAGSLQELSLDDFRTLDSLLEFVTKSPVSTAASTSAVEPQPVVETVATIVSSELIVPSPQVVTASAVVLDRSAVARFMVNYVVDQTGYPEDMVEMTADLEADLGIDSIKKAQLIGELAENFELTHLAGSLQELSLDDFRTLDSLLEFVARTPTVAATATTAAAAPPPVMELEASPAPNELSVPAPQVVSASAAPLDRSAVTKFMVNYVVDQTGYPEDMVEMTADLEADLGIDSIKKAQLIGELAENFELTHLAGSLQELSLDDFRTLDSLLEFVTRTPTTTVTSADEPQRVLEAVATTASNELVTSSPQVVSASAASLDRAAVTMFMVNYVVDQTGYPEDMVEMTADLEADLGIDSIKKAQLIGELAENFELTHLAGSLQQLSLDDFRTLDSLLEFVTKPPEHVPSEETPAAVEVQAAAETRSPAPAAPMTTTPVADAAREFTALASATSVTHSEDGLPAAFSVVPIRGSSYDMGLQHGQSQGAQIRAIMERYASMLGPRLQNIPELNEALAKPTMYFGEPEIQELQGIADGAELPMAAVLAHNLGMYPDYVPGCTQFAFTRQSNPRYGLVHAVNEDSPLSLTLPDCLSRIVQVRRPEGGIPHVTFSVSGQTGGLNGLNAAGLAITSTLLLDCPRRKETAIGKVHPVIVKRLLEQAETIEDALKLLRTLDRAGAWSLCLSEYKTDRLCYLEYDGDALEVQVHPATVLTTNHCLLQMPVADVPEHSRHRLARLHQLMEHSADEGVPLELAQQALRDRFDLERGRRTTHATMNTIRRVDNQISIVMLPELGELYVTPGPRSGDIMDTYYRLDVKQLLDTANWQPRPRNVNGQTLNGSTHNGVAAGNGEHVRTSSTLVTPSADPQAGLPAEQQRVVQRHVLRMVASPLPATSAALPQVSGSIAILGRNKCAEALSQKLTAAGHQVHLLSNTDGPESAVAELERLWAEQPIGGLFIVTARDDAAAHIGQGDWSRRRIDGLLTPFLVCQKWAHLVSDAKLAASSLLVGVTALGGDFGFSGRVHSFEGGGVTGLFKGLRRELPELLIKVIDAPLEESPANLAGEVLKEAAHRQGPLEVGSIRGQRSVVQAVPQPASAQRRGAKTPHGTWVVTGGARGVTAVVARELGRRFGLVMHLLGSTPEPQIDPSWRNLTDEGLKTLKRSTMDQARTAGKNPANTWKELERSIEIDRTLQAFRADGIDVSYHACNVADKAALATTLQQIRQQAGPIHGVIHGAGLEAACKFEKKKRELVEATLAVKVDAAVFLAELLADDPLECFLGFGSTSGRFGGMGQADYSMASDMLCKFCDDLHARRPVVSAIGLHWPPWADVGMAARPESKIALQSSNLAFMPPLEGAAHVIDELLSIATEGELLFLDKPDLIDTDGTMVTAALRPEYLRRDPLIQSAAIIDSIHDLRPGRSVIASALFDPTVEPFLLEHRHQGNPLLPAVVGMESMAEAARILAADDRKVVGLRNMTIHQGMRFLNDHAQRASITAEWQADAVRCRLEADFHDRHGRLVEAHRLQMDATFDLAQDYAVLSAVDLGPQPTEWTAHKYVVDWRTMKFPEEARVYHGYPFRALQDYAIVDGGLWARLLVPAPAQIAGDRPADGWILPSAIIDAGLLGADLVVWNTLRMADLPRAFDRIQLARPLRVSELLTLRVWLRERGERTIRADFVMVDTNGHVVLRVDGFEMVQVKTGTSSVTKETAVSVKEPAAAVAAPPPAAGNTANSEAGSRLAPAPMPAVATKSRMSGQTLKSSNGHLPPPAPLPGTAKPSASAVIAPASGTAEIPAARVAALPLVDAARWESPDQLVTELLFDPRADRFVSEHCFGGRPLLPAVIGLEAMIESASLAAPAGWHPVVSDFEIHAPCKFRDDTPQAARVVVERAGEAWKCRMVNSEQKTVVYQTAVIRFTDADPKLSAPPLDKPPFPLSPMQYAGKGQAQLTHGPGFQCLKALSLQREMGWCKVVAAAANNLGENRAGTQWFLPIATLDSCLVACGVDLFILMKHRVEIPQRCAALKIARLPDAGEVCTLKLFYRGHDEQHTTYDLCLYGAAGDVVLTIDGYRGVRTVKGADASLWDGDFKEMPV